MPRKVNREKTREGMRKVPSIAPTVAIAPSDYEHIFHEGPDGGKQVVPEAQQAATREKTRTTTHGKERDRDRDREKERDRGRTKDRKRKSRSDSRGRGPSRQRTMITGRPVAAPKPSRSFTRPRQPPLPKLTTERATHEEIGRFGSGGGGAGGTTAAGMPKVPSNAPTMAIAPSDYEHIYHGGPAQGNAALSPQNQNGPLMSPSPPAAAPVPQAPAPAHHQATTAHFPVASPVAPLPTRTTTATHLTNRGVAGTQMAATPRNVRTTTTDEGIVTTQAMERDGAFQNAYLNRPQRQATFTSGGIAFPQQPQLPPQRAPPRMAPQQGASYQQPSGAVLATPDGYTLLGQKPNPAIRGLALPPHIVRANNQFSRSVIARVAQYLASKAQNPEY